MSSPKKQPMFLKILYGIEDGILVIVISVMIIFSFAQIILRNFAGAGFIWGDAFLRFMVLWIGLLGAMVATREDNHISIDVVSYLVPARVKSILRIFTDFFTSFVCGLLSYASINFLLDEKLEGTVAFALSPTWDIEAWIFETILPFAFGVISLRYLFYLIIHIIEAIKGPKQTEDSTENEGGVDI